MEIQAILQATEYAIDYDNKIEKVSFYIHNNCVVISGLDKNEKVVKDIQLEVELEEFFKLAKLVANQ